MSTSPEDQSPTNDYSSSNREETAETTTSGGFTAVNGRSSPQAVKSNGIEDVIVVRSGHAPPEHRKANDVKISSNGWPHTTMNGDRMQRQGSADGRDSESPPVVGSPGKRKR